MMTRLNACLETDMINNLQAIAHKDIIVYYTVLSYQRYPLSTKISGQTLTNNIGLVPLPCTFFL
jgi:hypothetical protein